MSLSKHGDQANVVIETRLMGVLKCKQNSSAADHTMGRDGCKILMGGQRTLVCAASTAALDRVSFSNSCFDLPVGHCCVRRVFVRAWYACARERVRHGECKQLRLGRHAALLEKIRGVRLQHLQNNLGQTCVSVRAPHPRPHLG
jgi:hypothetical protein